MFKNILIGTKWTPKVGLLQKKYMMCVSLEFSLVLQKLLVCSTLSAQEAHIGLSKE